MKLFGRTKSSTSDEKGKSSVFLVTIPDYVGPGEEFHVSTGVHFVRVRCPPDSRPGQSLRITVTQRDPTPGSNAIDGGRRLPHDSPNVINSPATTLHRSCSWLKMRHHYGRGIDSSLLHCVIFTYALQEVGPNPLGTPLQQLEAYLDQCSNRSFHRSTITAKLELSRVVITRRMITLLLPLLFCEDDDETSPGRTSNKRIPVRFSSVRIQSASRFFSRSDVVTSEQAMDVCTHEDKVSFLAALARGPKEGLSLVSDCPDIVSNFLHHPEIDCLHGKRLEICQRSDLRDVEYVSLGAMIQRSVQIADLSLSLPFVNAPRDFYDTLANATHIQKLKLCILGRILKPQRDEIISNLVVGEYGNGVVGRLLRNPQNQLIHLVLQLQELDNDNLIALAQLLPTSHVKKIDLSRSHIQPPGLLELFRQLPNMRSLNSIAFLVCNLAVCALEDRLECGAALLHGFIENPSITEVSPLNLFPQHLLLGHYCTLNRAGRRILTSDGPPIPDGLWPIILARAGRDEDGEHHASANAVYFLLQNHPTLCSYCGKCKDTVGPPNQAPNLWAKSRGKYTKMRQLLLFRHE